MTPVSYLIRLNVVIVPGGEKTDIGVGLDGEVDTEQVHHNDHHHLKRAGGSMERAAYGEEEEDNPEEGIVDLLVSPGTQGGDSSLDGQSEHIECLQVDAQPRGHPNQGRYAGIEDIETGIGTV